MDDILTNYEGICSTQTFSTFFRKCYFNKYSKRIENIFLTARSPDSTYLAVILLANLRHYLDKGATFLFIDPFYCLEDRHILLCRELMEGGEIVVLHSSIQRFEELKASCIVNDIDGINNIMFKESWNPGLYDVIIVDTILTAMPEIFKKMLKPKGKIVANLGGNVRQIVPEGEHTWTENNMIIPRSTYKGHQFTFKRYNVYCPFFPENMLTFFCDLADPRLEFIKNKLPSFSPGNVKKLIQLYSTPAISFDSATLIKELVKGVKGDPAILFLNFGNHFFPILLTRDILKEGSVTVLHNTKKYIDELKRAEKVTSIAQSSTFLVGVQDWKPKEGGYHAIVCGVVKSIPTILIDMLRPDGIMLVVEGNNSKKIVKSESSYKMTDLDLTFEDEEAIWNEVPDKLLKILNRIKKTRRPKMDCSNCFSPTTATCFSGHSFCYFCKKKKAKCEECDKSKPIRCKGFDQGCKKFFSKDVLEIHEAHCQFVLLHDCVVTGCKVSAPASKFHQHIMTHELSVQELPIKICKTVSSVDVDICEIFLDLTNVFIFRLKTTKEALVAAVSFVGDFDQLFNYEVEVSVSGEMDKTLTINNHLLWFDIDKERIGRFPTFKLPIAMLKRLIKNEPITFECVISGRDKSMDQIRKLGIK